ncbi:LacI family DNA-binding transcriptional regulator [Microbacterium karelineae]|uniref:LacI family DNA-binding transcriptional regulator n=1 Tax=Microbacterium karelineae TaxID=2654283 RepID=UPI0012EB048E|nr:LacI family DNA-binding transcriptional regulator [Microbacterium karelineae]
MGATGATDPATSPERRADGRPATIYDVARAAEVSHQTVSRFIRGDDRIRPQTRERVEAAMAALDYRMNLTARSLRTRRSNRIAALTHDIAQVGPSKTAQGASNAAREAGYLLDFVSLDFRDRTAVDDALELIARQDLAGVLALSATDEVAEAFAGMRFHAPAFIVTEDDEPRPEAPITAPAIGLRAAVAHLAELGHRRIFHIAGPDGWRSARNRAAAYRRELARHGLEPAGEAPGDWSSASGYAAAAAVPRGATAVIAANDQMALGAILAFEERGRRVPDDISIIGFDGIAESAYFRPPLTTIQQDFEQQGRRAFAQLLLLLDGPDSADVPPERAELIVRSSTAPPPS